MTLVLCSDRLLRELPLSLFNWRAPRFPVIVSVAHAGRTYPRSLIDNLSVDPSVLTGLEDRLVDALARSVIDAGFPVIMANAPRAMLDCNRDTEEVDRSMAPDMPGGYRPPSIKQRAGLGLIPSRLPKYGPLWREPVGWVEIARRISGHHQPFHGKIAHQMARLRQEFGAALLVDLHSMPPLTTAYGTPPARVVFGTLHGESTSPLFADIVMDRARAADLTAGFDRPYPGGYTLATHGEPRRGMHALQIEIDRTLYLEPGGLALGTMAPALARWLLDTVQTLSDAIVTPQRLAAE